MTPKISSPFLLFKDFATKLTDVFALPMHFNQEDQLKGPPNFDTFPSDTMPNSPISVNKLDSSRCRS